MKALEFDLRTSSGEPPVDVGLVDVVVVPPAGDLALAGAGAILGMSGSGFHRYLVAVAERSRKQRISDLEYLS